MTDLTSIGTLFAFILVSGGILVLNPHGKPNSKQKSFIVPYLNSRFFLVPFWIAMFIVVWKTTPNGVASLYSDEKYPSLIHYLPNMFFVITSLVISYFAVVRCWSLIPVLGLLTNLYLMSQLGITNWMRFGIWLAIGLLIYFGYGMTHSRLSAAKTVD
jgi:hypothetical protein